MSRRKRYIKGRLFYSNDKILTKSDSKNRRIIAVNNDGNNMHVRRVLSASGGRNAKNGIPIERYPDVPKDSVLENRVIRQTVYGEPLQSKRMRKSNTRLNKWDRKKAHIK